jgi:hypothetical protein
MKAFSFVLFIILTFSAPLFAQTGISGGTVKENTIQKQMVDSLNDLKITILGAEGGGIDSLDISLWDSISVDYKYPHSEPQAALHIISYRCIVQNPKGAMAFYYTGSLLKSDFKNAAMHSPKGSLIIIYDFKISQDGKSKVRELMSGPVFRIL